MQLKWTCGFALVLVCWERHYFSENEVNFQSVKLTHIEHMAPCVKIKDFRSYCITLIVFSDQKIVLFPYLFLCRVVRFWGLSENIPGPRLSTSTHTATTKEFVQTFIFQPVLQICIQILILNKKNHYSDHSE